MGGTVQEAACFFTAGNTLQAFPNVRASLSKRIGKNNITVIGIVVSTQLVVLGHNVEDRGVVFADEVRPVRAKMMS